MLGRFGALLPGDRVGAFADRMLGALKDTNSPVKVAAVSALGHLGGPLPQDRAGAVADALLELLKNLGLADDAAAEALGRLGAQLPADRIGAITVALLAAVSGEVESQES